jgi:hypothetical protein
MMNINEGVADRTHSDLLNKHTMPGDPYTIIINANKEAIKNDK